MEVQVLNAEKVVKYYERTQWLIKQQAKGLSHADSMLTLPSWDNCMNWVLGHLLHYRDNVLRLLGDQPTMSDEDMLIYKRESEPLTDGDKAIPLLTLLKALDESYDLVVAALQRASPDALAAIFDEENGQTVADRIEFIQWHETYHVGQLEILRQLAGTNDAII
jgi:hypothetical protein